MARSVNVAAGAKAELEQARQQRNGHSLLYSRNPSWAQNKSKKQGNRRAGPKDIATTVMNRRRKRSPSQVTEALERWLWVFAFGALGFGPLKVVFFVPA